MPTCSRHQLHHQPHMRPAMEPHRCPRTLREEDLNWISSQTFLVKLQVSGIAEGLEALQCAFNRLEGELRILTAQMDQMNRNKQPRKKCIIVLDSLDDQLATERLMQSIQSTVFKALRRKPFVFPLSPLSLLSLTLFCRRPIRSTRV